MQGSAVLHNKSMHTLLTSYIEYMTIEVLYYRNPYRPA